MNIRNRTILLGALWLGVVVSFHHAADGSPGQMTPARGSPAETDVSKVPPTRSPDKVVVYKTTPQGDLKAHIYFPPNWSAKDRRPAIVLWVGGAFRSGTVTEFLSKAEYFGSRGMVAICAEYRGRLLHNVLLDSCAEDARSSMRWIKSHAAELGIAPDKVVACGGSAGGTLSFLVSREKGPDAGTDDLTVTPRPSALVLFNPAVGKRVLDVIGWGGPAQAGVNAQVLALDTPQHNEPPMIMFYGTKDNFLPVAREYHRKAQAMGHRCEIWIADKMGHAFFNFQPWHDATLYLADKFLVSLGYLEGPPTIKENPAARLTLDE
jgi:acetyl esterase